MPYPVDIPSTITGYSVGVNGTRGRFGFEYSGAFYAFLNQDGIGTPEGDFKIHAMKSADAGLTWTELNAANAPDGNPGTASPLISGFGDCYTAFRDGATAWVLTVRVNDFQVILGITATPFDLGAGTWGSSTNYTSPLPDYMANSGGGGSQVMLSGAVCGPGNYQVLMSGTSETISGHRYTRSWIASFNGSAWGAAVELPGQAGNAWNYAPCSALGDANGRAHFAYMGDQGNAIGSPIYHVALDADGVTFGTTAAITNDFYWVQNNVIGAVSELILFADQIGIAIELNDNVASTLQSINVFYGTVALNPVWSNSTATTGVDGSDPTVPTIDFSFWIAAGLTLSYTNGSLLVAWTVGDPTHIAPPAYWSTQSPYPAFSWATPAQLFTPSISGNRAVQVISFPVAAGVGLIGMGFAPSDDGHFLAQFFLVPIGGARLLPNRIKLPGQIL